MSRLTKSRKLKLNVFRHICHEGERWGIDIIDRKGTLLQSRWTAKRANWRQAGQDYRGSALRGDNFVLLDFLGRQSYKLNVIQLEVKILGALGASHTD